MAEGLKKGQVSFHGASPMSLSELTSTEDLQDLTEQQSVLVRSVGSTVAAYIKESKDLLSGRLAHLKGWAPPHLAEPGNVLVASCADGVVIRYETKSDGPSKVISAWLDGSLLEVASALSQKLIHIRRDASDLSAADDSGTELKLFTTNTQTGESNILAAARIIFDVILTRPTVAATPGSKPFCLLSIRNSLEFQLRGELLPMEESRGSRQSFLARSLLRLPVGWDCIEVFPSAAASDWQANFAATWAERDILAAVVSHQFREAQLNSLDPNSEARRRLAALLDHYKQLLDSNPQKEEILQAFLSANPALLCPTQTRTWPKLALGSHVTDFVFQEATGDYLLVELEKSIDPLFTKSGHPSHQLTHARGQIQDWKRYLEDNLSTVQRELSLHGISPSPRCLIVIGRSSTLSQDNRRKLVTIENEAPRLKILTYDDIYDNAKAVVENLLGPLWNVQGNTRIYYLSPKAITGALLPS